MILDSRVVWLRRLKNREENHFFNLSDSESCRNFRVSKNIFNTIFVHLSLHLREEHRKAPFARSSSKHDSGVVHDKWCHHGSSGTIRDFKPCLKFLVNHRCFIFVHLQWSLRNIFILLTNLINSLFCSTIPFTFFEHFLINCSLLGSLGSIPCGAHG